MRAAGLINWDKVRDWLAQAGCAVSGHYADYEPLRIDRAAAHPLHQTPKVVDNHPSIVWTLDGREI
ncbi:hypothetical protein FHX08_005600 [Rhizobium sp. BK529]|uniref:hypothetical protein n=1 Tax=unclassified Rhizobium TaxID=2613769 RepID=UPI00104512C6|nr:MULTISPECIES: hypothetical protein [unclassified Rhizobium]MBB3595190.1 hypothetical protein [Rhizobium sp. BK529]TCR94755.1 hypothetical protein EV281_1159 [Rhizobium sp. BK418]